MTGFDLQKARRPRRRLRRGRWTISTCRSAWRKSNQRRRVPGQAAPSQRHRGGVPDDECRRPRPDRARWRTALARRSPDPGRCSRSSCSGTGWSSTRPTRRREEELDRGPLGVESVSFAERADNEALAYYIDRVNQATGGQGRLEKLVAAERRSPGGRGVGGLRPPPEGHRRRMTAADLVFEAGEFSRFKNAPLLRRVDHLTPSEHKRRRRPPRRHHQGRQSAPPQRTSSSRPGTTCRAPRIPEDLARPVPRPARQAPCDQGVRRLVARREDMLARGAQQEQGQRRHGARAGMLGLGRRPHGRNRPDARLAGRPAEP